MPKPSLRLRISNQQSVPAAPNPTKPSLEATAKTSAAFLPLTSLLNLPVTTPTLPSLLPVSFRGSTITTHTETCNITSLMDNRSPPPTTTTTTTEASLGIHRGAIDNTAITTQPPSEVMTKVRDVLDSIGVSVEPESTFRFRCIRPSQSVSSGSDVASSTFQGSSDSNTLGVAAPAVVIYADDPSRDPAGEVRFSVELTRLVGLNDTYCLDIRRLKGNLRSYQFLYETIRNRTHLTA